MALIKSVTLPTGITCDNAYHVITSTVVTKRVSDEADPDGIRNEATPAYLWKAGSWARIAVSVYASKDARAAGAIPVTAIAFYPTDVASYPAGGVEVSQEMIFEFDPTSQLSVIDQAYGHLLALTRFSGAISD